MIYSKYIEGGLIPIALALEELGFSRYGDANYTKSLFKTAPNANTMPYGLNPNTMQANVDGSAPVAKYVMITGQKYYSPNNAADLKLVVDPSNKNGEHIRVILISEAGSEGLDFKNIRQVHILEPWYNMNRVEQVIGRAVRHKSHCGLPLDKRNVEIYMHGSYWNEEEEMADMYVYRLAEKKAFIIGQVTRVLKETAVDCLLNIDQTNFTEEKMNQTISLTLSSKKKVDYRIGDKPFTYMCDYMQNCSFSCSKNVDKTNVDKTNDDKKGSNTSTYDLHFLQSNHSRISKRIRQLFREKSIFELDELVQEISIIKPFPIDKIYYTISIFLQFQEWLVDKKGQKGYMIKTDKIYAFQPIEISDEHASIFERKVPLDYKRPAITIQLPKDPILSTSETITKKTPIPSKSVQRLTELGMTVAVPKKSEYLELFSLLQKKIEYVLGESSFVKPKKAERDWYVYAKLVFRICVEKHKMERKKVIGYILHHFLDMLSITDKLIFLQELVLEKDIQNSSLPKGSDLGSDLGSLENQIRHYFLAKLSINEKKPYILLNSLHGKQENKLYSLVSSIWKPYTSGPSPETEKWIQTFNKRTQLLEILNKYADTTELNIGFIGMLKENVFGFKIMNINSDRTRPNPGALCDQADKKKIIHKINELLVLMKKDDEIYSEDPTFHLNSIEKPSLCILYELLMRHYTEQEKELWYLSPEEAIESKLESFIVRSQNIYGQKLFFLVNN